jgi:hypothetical protein
MAGDYSRKRIIYQDKSTSINFAATDGDTTLITGRTNYTLYIQKVIVMFKTSAAQAITFQDSNSSPVYVTKIAASPGADTRWEFDFGPEGKPLTSGKNLSMVMTAGNAGHVEVLAYQKPDDNVAVAST